MKKTTLLLITFFTYFLNNATAQWQTTNRPSASATVTAMAVSSTNLFANMNNGVHSYAGAVWSFPANSACPLTGTDDINAFLVSGNNLFAAFQTDAGVWLSPDSGASWLPAYKGLPTTLVGQLYAVNTLNSSGAAYPLFAGTEKGVYSTLNNGSTWTASGLLINNIRCLATHGNEVFAGTNNAGVYYSSNNGANWTAINTGLTDTTILSLLYAGIDTLYAGTTHGIFKTINNGNTWTNVSLGLPTNFAVGGALVKYGTTVIAGLKNDGVFVSTSANSSWTLNNTGLLSWDINSLAIKGVNLYAGIGQGGVWVRPLNQLTAVNDLDGVNKEITISPNPVSTVCTIFTNNFSNSILTVRDLTGRTLLQQTFHNRAAIDVSALTQGVYIIEIKSNTGSRLSKLIKE